VLVGAPKPRPSGAYRDLLKVKREKERAAAESSKPPPLVPDDDTASSSSSSHGYPTPKSPRVVPQFIEEVPEEASEDISSLVFRSDSPSWGQPSVKEIETTATLSFLRDKWAPSVKLTPSFEDPSFGATSYVDRFLSSLFLRPILQMER
jgi:hypothetical protein